jgi:hypothetical protein
MRRYLLVLDMNLPALDANLTWNRPTISSPSKNSSPVTLRSWTWRPPGRRSCHRWSSCWALPPPAATVPRLSSPAHPSRAMTSAVSASLAAEPPEVTGRAKSNLLDVRLDRAAAQDDALERRLGQADPLGQPTAANGPARTRPPARSGRPSDKK